jgi:hypothetical protein
MSQTISTAELPDVITRYMTAHCSHDTRTATTAFVDDATVIDEGNTYRGIPPIAAWLNRSATEYTHTNRLTGAQRFDATHCVTNHHLEGNFPGGVVDLRYQSTLRDSLIEALTIEP